MRLSLRSAQRWDGWLMGAAVLLTLWGLAAMASASVTLERPLTLRHLGWVIVGVVGCVLVSRTSYRRWSDGAAALYGISLLALLLVIVAGTMRLGATRWLSLFGLSVQPSEMAKLTTTWLLARYLAGQPRPLPLRAFCTSLLLAGAPLLLIFAQPDLGSASIVGAIWLGIVWVAGASRRTLAGIAAGAFALAPLAWHVLKAYQRDRLLAFINPHADPLGAGYTIIQSTIAIGSGQLWGRGWFAGTQNQLSFLPERHSDFVFSVIGEEWGFLGAMAVVIAFGVLLLRIHRIALDAPDDQGRLLAAGIGVWIGYQALANIGMVMGLLPVVGIPLPLISYGGSSMVMLWAALGLLQSVRRGV